MPALNVMVENVEVPKNADPCTEKSAAGEVVPTPTLPLPVTMKVVAVLEPITNAGAAPIRPDGLMEKRPNGVDEATPTKPVPRKVVEAMYEVDDACKPAWNQIAVEVEFATAPKLVVPVNGNTPAPPVIAPHVITPLESVVSALPPEQVPKLPMVVEPILLIEKKVELTPRAVDEPTEKMTLVVDDARPEATTLRSARGEVVPMPTVALRMLPIPLLSA